MISEKYYTVSQAAEMKKFTSSYIRKLISEGKLKAEKIANTWLIAARDLKSLKRERFVKKGEKSK